MHHEFMEPSTTVAYEGNTYIDCQLCDQELCSGSLWP